MDRMEDSMKTALWTGYGPPEVLRLGEREKPVPKANEILIKIKYTTVTLGDCEMRALALPAVYRLPIRAYMGFGKPRGFTLGQEFAGIVEEIGSAVTRFAAGDAVLGQTGVSMGAYAQYLAVKENAILVKKPENVGFAEAACLPLGGLEAKYFIDRSGLQAGSKALVIGAGGSIGTMAIQLLKLLGAEVSAVDTGAKFAVMREAGADQLIDYTKTNYLHGEPVYDGIFDVVGKTPLKRGTAMLRPGGVYMHANPKISQMIFRRFYTGGGKRLLFKTGEQNPANLQALADLMAGGKISPLIDQIMPLDEIVRAHHYVEAGKKNGNLVISVDDAYM